MNNLDFSNSQQIDAIFQEAVDKAISQSRLAPIAKHQKRSELIAVLDKNGKVIIVAPEDIDRFKLQKAQKVEY